MEKKPGQLLPYLSGLSLLPSVIFLCGPDDYTRNRLISQIIERYLPNKKDYVFGLENFEAQDTDPSRLLGALKTLPFGLARKILILRRFELVATSVKKGDRAKEGAPKGVAPIEESLIRYFSHPSRKTLLIISSSQELKKTHPFTKALPQDAILVPCRGLMGREPLRFVKQKLKELGKTASESWVEQFVEICGPDAQKLSGELEKISLYAGARAMLGEEDLVIVSPGEFSRDVFALLDAIARGAADTAIEIVREIIGSGEPPLRILSLLLWHFRLVAKVHRLETFVPSDATARIHPSRFVAQKITRHARFLSRQRLNELFGLLREADMRLKGSRIPPPQVMERLVYALSKR